MVYRSTDRPLPKSLVINPFHHPSLTASYRRVVKKTASRVGMFAPGLGLLLVLVVAGARGAAADPRNIQVEDTHAAAGIAPEEAFAVLRIREGTADRSRWSGVILDAIGVSAVEVGRHWKDVTRMTRQLVGRDVECIHATDAEGANWLHAVRWRDAGSLERRLQRLGPRSLGRGRFRFVDSSIDLVMAGPWLVLAPTGSSWLDHATERARVDGFGAKFPGQDSKTADVPSAPIEILIRHEAPTGGETLVSLTPGGPGEAMLEISGRYASSPLPIRPQGQFAARLIPSLQGRVALAVLESGVGVLDPALIQISAELPALIPAANVRQILASRRLIVLDGETIRIPRVGLIDVPAFCVAIPCRDSGGTGEASAAVCEQSTQLIHGWLADAGRSVQARFSAASEPGSNPSKTSTPTTGIEVARDGIHHLELGPEFRVLTGGHPASLAASLNWTIRRIENDGPHDAEPSSMQGAWVLVGSSPGIVRRVGEAIERSKSHGLEEPVCMRGVASPARLGLQFSDLAALRGRSDDRDALADASVLEQLSRFLARVHRVEWSTSLQTEDAVRATARITLSPDSIDPHVPRVPRVPPVQLGPGGQGVKAR